MSPESYVRLACFGAVLLFMAMWEAVAPRRRTSNSGRRRWSNLALVAVDTVVVRVLFPLGAVGIALFAETAGWGLLNRHALPPWLTVPVTVIALDLAVYLQHLLFHALPLLWRLHMVHHSDVEFDVTTGVRFHTIEILLSMGVKGAAILVLGPPALGVLLFEVLLSATSMFNHGNVRMPASLDRVLRLIVVTPEMHRVHHSIVARETNSNFGFNLPWWDYLFGTYRAQPAAGHEGMTIGLSQFRDDRVASLPWMLALPFVGEPGDYPLNRSDDGGTPARTAGV